MIPDRDQEQAAVNSPAASAVQLLAYLHAAGISRTEAARQLGVSKSLFSQYVNGHKAWTTQWQARLEGWLKRREEGS